jgi:predicted PurR-regulated permease PerM
MKLFSSRPKTTAISITNESILRTIVIAMLAFIGLRLIVDISHELTLFGVAIFLAIALNPAVGWISRRLKIKSRALAVGIAYIIVLGVLATFLTLVVPPLVSQTTEFAKNIPQTVSNFRNHDSTLARTLHKYKLDDQINTVSNEFSKKFKNISGPLLSTAGRIGATIVAIVTVLVLTFMVLVEGPGWLDHLWAMQPTTERARRRKVANKMYHVVTGYVNGQVLIAFIASTFATVALFIGSTLAGVSVNPVALAGIVFIFGLIPLIGNSLAAVVVITFCLFSSTGLAIGMAAYFLVYLQIENATLQPYIQSRSNNLTPLIVFVSALIGAQLGGLLGALAAIPLAGCLRILFDEYIADRLPSAEPADDSEVEVDIDIKASRNN